MASKLFTAQGRKWAPNRQRKRKVNKCRESNLGKSAERGGEAEVELWSGDG